MKGKILVPLDGSKLAERAIPLAVSMASRSDQRVELLHVHFPVPALWSTGIPAKSIRLEFETAEAADTYVNEARSRIAEALRDRVTAGVRTGDVADELISELVGDVTMLVMTTQGRTGLRGVLLGRMARRVVRDAPVPVVLVGPRVEGWPRAAAVKIESIMVALDGSRSADAVLEVATRIATWYEADLHLVGVVPVGVGFGYPSVPHGGALESGAAVDTLAAHLAQKVMEVRAAGVPASHAIMRGDNVASALVRAASELKADLIAMSTHGRNAALQMLLGSVSEAVLEESPVPVLLQRPPRSG